MEHLTFAAQVAIRKNQSVLYVTERCVFRLRSDGLELVEVAPGVDIGSDILAQMSFEPIITRPPRQMDERIFRAGAMGLRRDLTQPGETRSRLARLGT